MGRRRLDEPDCGQWMPRAGENCARGQGHKLPHRTRKALDAETAGKKDKYRNDPFYRADQLALANERYVRNRGSRER